MVGRTGDRLRRAHIDVGRGSNGWSAGPNTVTVTSPIDLASTGIGDHQRLAAGLAADHNHYVAAREAELLVGYGGISRLGRTPPFEYEIHTIGVDPAYQGRGIGRRMLDALLQIAADSVVHLEVRTDNEPAIALYRSVGFTEVGLRRRYYRISGADAYTMRREGAR